MLSIPGIYENGKIRFLEHIHEQGRFDVIITFLEDRRKAFVKEDNLVGLLSDLNENDFKGFLEFSQNRRQDWFTGRRLEA